jgi:diguanylate cyclase (GGDEF)-like protein/PAS domain S-box-containing protein
MNATMLDDVDQISNDLECLTQFLYLAPIGLIQAELNGEITMVNPLCSQYLMPLSQDGCMSNLFDALKTVAPDLQSRVKDFQPESGTICDEMHLTIRSNGLPNTELKILSLNLLKVDASRLMAVINDVTTSVQRERQLQRSEAWFNAIFNGVTDYALTSVDSQGRICQWNESIERLTGFSKASTLGKPFSVLLADLAPLSEPQLLLDRIHDADDNGWSMHESWHRRADGSKFWGSCLIAPLKVKESVKNSRPTDEEPIQYSLIIRDISEQREARENIRQAIACDHLTGLANRRAFFEAAETEVLRLTRSPRPLSAIMLDADHFKKINDKYGHAAGDAVLRHLAAGLGVSFNGNDLVARIGGEEFVVLPGVPQEKALELAQDFCQRISTQKIVFDGKAIQYSVSAGVAEFKGLEDSLDSLLQRADSALYAAKANGRNRALGFRKTQR